MISSQGVTFPLVLSPDPSRGAVVHPAQHLSHPTEMAGAVHTEEEEDGAPGLPLLECAVQSLVPVLSAAPDLVLDTPVDVIFTVTFHHKKSGVFRTEVKISWVVIIHRLEFV